MVKYRNKTLFLVIKYNLRINRRSKKQEYYSNKFHVRAEYGFKLITTKAITNSIYGITDILIFNIEYLAGAKFKT